MRYSKEDDAIIKTLIRTTNLTYSQIGEKINRKGKSVKNRAYKLGIKTSSFPKRHYQITVCLSCGENVEALKKDNRKYCSKSCAAKVNNKNFPKKKRVKFNFCKNCGKDSGRNKKFCSLSCFAENKNKKRFHSKNPGPHCVRNFLLRELENKCFGCNLSSWKNSWFSGKIPLEVDHIDGNYKNNSLENLRLLCPTCHSTTETFKAKNKGRGRKNRKA